MVAQKRTGTNLQYKKLQQSVKFMLNLGGTVIPLSRETEHLFIWVGIAPIMACSTYTIGILNHIIYILILHI
jgi:hypothetical protein